MSGTLLAELLGAAEGLPAVDDLGADEQAEQARRPARRVFPTEDAKFDAVVEKTQRDAHGRPAGADRHAHGRGVEEAVREADRGGRRRTRCSTPSRTRARPRSWPQAGQPGTVTVATNMAGRGTDIKLGAGRGGGRRAARHRHGAARGRADRPAARSAAPAGRATPAPRFMLSLEDQLLEGLGTASRTNWRPWAEGGEPQLERLRAPLFRIAQPHRETALQAAPRPEEPRQAAPGNAQGHRRGPVCGLKPTGPQSQSIACGLSYLDHIEPSRVAAR